MFVPHDHRRAGSVLICFSEGAQEREGAGHAKGPDGTSRLLEAKRWTVPEMWMARNRSQESPQDG